MNSTSPAIGSQWVKANAIGGAINLAVTFAAFVVGRVLGVGDAGTSEVLQAGFVVAAAAALTFGLFVLGYLSGVVLRTKLPAFPMRSWLALYVALGGIFGLISAYAWLSPETAQDTDPVDTDIVLGLALGAAIAGVAISAAVGSLQALILRPAAVGLGLWIGCCAIAGVLFALVVPAVIYGPQSGFAQEFVIEVVTLAMTILAAGILVPAVNRLRPR